MPQKNILKIPPGVNWRGTMGTVPFVPFFSSDATSFSEVERKGLSPSFQPSPEATKRPDRLIWSFCSPQPQSSPCRLGAATGLVSVDSLNSLRQKNQTFRSGFLVDSPLDCRSYRSPGERSERCPSGAFDAVENEVSSSSEASSGLPRQQGTLRRLSLRIGREEPGRTKSA